MAYEFWQWIRGKAVRPAVAHKFELSLIDDDVTEPHSVEPPSWSELEPISGFPCILTYVNAKDERSQRLITCQRLEMNGGERYLWAYCHSKNGIRNFKISRIVEVFDAASGECYDVQEFFDQFRLDATSRSKFGWGLPVKQKADLTALLNALVFLAKCDRDFHHLERESLQGVIESFWLRLEAPGEPDCNFIVAHADRLAPDAEIFFVSIQRCLNDPRLVRILRAGAKEIIDADGRIAPEEAYWGAKIDEILNREL